MTKINKYSNIPLYCQLKSIIFEKIESGAFEENKKIPSEQEFCEIYNISRPTVRQAINELTKSGILYKQKGRGTFVAESKSTININNYSGFNDSILDCENPSEKHLIYLKQIHIRDNKSLAEVFNENEKSDCEFAEIMYLNEKNQKTFSVNISYIPLKYFPNIIEDIKQNKPSYDILRDKYPLVPSNSHTSVEVIYTDQTDARYLQIQPGQALIKINNTLYSKNGHVVEYVISKYRADKCIFIYDNKK